MFRKSEHDFFSKIQFEMKKTLDSLSIRIELELNPKNTFENTIEVEIIVFTRTMRFDMKSYYLNNVA